MNKILIFGNGFIANRLIEYLSNSIIVSSRINNIDDIYNEIRTYNPDIIINCIGKTGKPNVDWCEDNKEETFLSNVTVPTFMAEVCQKYDKYMVHIGSGCIYEGDNKYTEKDNPNFKGSFYSRTKIFSENILRNYDNVLQLRIRMPIDNRPSQKNLITKLINYKRVINIPNSVTYIPDLAKITKILIQRKETGIFNVVNDGSIAHKEILEMYRNIVDPKFDMPIFIPLEELGTKAPRSNCTLSAEKLENIGIKMNKTKDVIKECMEEYKNWV